MADTSGAIPNTLDQRLLMRLAEPNVAETVLASAARTTTTNSADFTNENCRGGHFIINVTAVTATPSLTVKIQGYDSVGGTYYDILSSSAITTTGVTVFKVYPGITAVANLAAPDVLPVTWRVRVEAGDSDSATYSISANLVA